MKLKNINPHQRVELVKILMHDQFKFRWNYDADELEFKYRDKTDWDGASVGLMRLIIDILNLHGYKCSFKKMLKIFKEDELIHYPPPLVVGIEDFTIFNKSNTSSNNTKDESKN